LSRVTRGVVARVWGVYTGERCKIKCDATSKQFLVQSRVSPFFAIRRKKAVFKI
jgi:hypothetical protein